MAVESRKVRFHAPLVLGIIVPIDFMPEGLHILREGIRFHLGFLRFGIRLVLGELGIYTGTIAFGSAVHEDSSVVIIGLRLLVIGRLGIVAGVFAERGSLHEGSCVVLIDIRGSLRFGRPRLARSGVRGSGLSSGGLEDSFPHVVDMLPDPVWRRPPCAEWCEPEYAEQEGSALTSAHALRDLGAVLVV